MKKAAITSMMWEYQHHFRWEFEHLANAAMAQLGIPRSGLRALLIGAPIPGSGRQHAVCVEAGDEKPPAEVWTRLLDAIEENVRSHPLHHTLYGDEPRNREKPGVIRRDAVRKSVHEALRPSDADQQVLSFAGMPASVAGYYVVPVVQVPRELFERFKPLREPISDGTFTGSPSLIHAVVEKLLGEASLGLSTSDPGRDSATDWAASASEIVRRAAAAFMYTPGIAIKDPQDGAGDLFERLNLISSLMYEGAGGTGKLLLADPSGGGVEVVLSLAQSVPFRDTRWSRKILQMASSETALIGDGDSIIGLGMIAADSDPWSTQNVFSVDFHGHYHWSLSCGAEVLLVSKYGIPTLPQARFPKAQLVDSFQRLFPEAGEEDVSDFTALFDVAGEQQYGSMLLVARDAAAEAARLRGQGTKVVPTKLTPELFRRVSNIDGTIIVDPHCVCHAIGVILDGPARPECTPSRGARYNSAVRYVGATTTPRLAVVVSEDGTIDVIPVLRPRVSRKTVQDHISRLERSTWEGYHAHINWLDERRFYLDGAQCARINAALLRIDRERSLRAGEIMFVRKEFVPDPACTEEYLEA